MIRTAELRISGTTGRIQGASSEIRSIVWGGMDFKDAFVSLWNQRWLISNTKVHCGQIIASMHYLSDQADPCISISPREELSTIINRWIIQGGRLSLKEFCDIAITLLQLIKTQL